MSKSVVNSSDVTWSCQPRNFFLLCRFLKTQTRFVSRSEVTSQDLSMTFNIAMSCALCCFTVFSSRFPPSGDASHFSNFETTGPAETAWKKSCSLSGHSRSTVSSSSCSFLSVYVTSGNRVCSFCLTDVRFSLETTLDIFIASRYSFDVLVSLCTLCRSFEKRRTIEWQFPTGQSRRRW